MKRRNLLAAIFLVTYQPTYSVVASELVDECGDINSKYASSGKRVEAISECIGKLARAIEIPKGAIIAFDRVDGCPKVGWEPFLPAQGRFIVGVDGENYELPYKNGTPDYQYGGTDKTKLEVNHLPNHFHQNHHQFLAHEHVNDQVAYSRLDRKKDHPSHKKYVGRHRLELVGSLSLGEDTIISDDIVGFKDPNTGNAKGHAYKLRQRKDAWWSDPNSEQFSNLPPYVAVYYCKKTEQ